MSVISLEMVSESAVKRGDNSGSSIRWDSGWELVEAVATQIDLERFVYIY